ncbi:Fucose permease [Aquimarina amphilecti]|uniref:Fucose permease n=1 Tax=Aquimarina amphilecti TaxID=1038014 RepID=A0A1H7WF61_AQUAM|nr:MFS transporter [Aquimarina amphilecti]SEM20163.1 Fucose permease [Aquimarina amphilecti]
MNSLYLILTKLRYFGPAWVFASLNIMTGTWVLYIPRIRTKLLIDDAQLGIALFCFALGTLTMIPISSLIIRKLGVGKTTITGITIFSILFLMPIAASSYTLLCVVLFVVGLFACLTDIAMNALVSEIEQEDNVHIMSASHGFFSLGGVIGAGIGGFLITYFEIPLMHMLCAAVFVIITNSIVCKQYLTIKGKEEERSEKSFDLQLIKPLLGLTIIAFLVMGSEGAIEHWSKLYIQDVVKISSEKISGFGFVAFSLMMTLGRFFGDAVSKHFGSFAIIIGGSLVSAFGFLAVLSVSLNLTIIGFGLVGLGFSVIIPELFRLAGKVKGVSSAKGISFVAGFGYLGFLISPPFLGFLSKIGSLKLSFIALLIATIIALTVTLLISKRVIK